MIILNGIDIIDIRRIKKTLIRFGDRFKQKWLKPKTPIKNLYLTGQDVTTVGFTSALFSGLLTSSVILKKNLTKNL